MKNIKVVKAVFFFFLLLSQLVSNAQMLTIDEIFEGSTQRKIIYKEFNTEQNSFDPRKEPYLFRSLQQFVIITKKGDSLKLPGNINILNNTLILKFNDEFYTVDERQAVQVLHERVRGVIYDEYRKIKTENSIVLAKRIYTGASTLDEYYSLAEKKGYYNQRLGVGFDASMAYISKHYILTLKDSQVKYLPQKKNEFINQFIGQESSIRAYIKINNLDIENGDHIKLIVEFYDKLNHNPADQLVVKYNKIEKRFYKSVVQLSNSSNINYVQYVTNIYKFNYHYGEHITYNNKTNINFWVPLLLNNEIPIEVNMGVGLQLNLFNKGDLKYSKFYGVDNNDDYSPIENIERLKYNDKPVRLSYGLQFVLNKYSLKPVFTTYFLSNNSKPFIPSFQIGLLYNYSKKMDILGNLIYEQYQNNIVSINTKFNNRLVGINLGLSFKINNMP